MKANTGKAKGIPGYNKASQTTIPNRNIKQQNMKMQANIKKNQRAMSRKGRT